MPVYSYDGICYRIRLSYYNCKEIWMLYFPRGPQQAEILDTDAEIRAEILLEIRDPKSQAIFFPIISVKYGNLYHVNCNV